MNEGTTNQGEAGELDSRDELARALNVFAPDLRLLDRGLVLEGEGGDESELAADLEDSVCALGDLTVDWVAVDVDGRLNLVVWLEEGEDHAALDPVALALELLYRAQIQLPFLERHLGECGIRQDLAPRLVLAAGGFEESAVHRLSVIGEQRICLIEVQEVRTDSGASHHFVAVWPECSQALEVGPEQFLERLSDELRPVGSGLVERLQRLDERVVLDSMGLGHLQWHLGEQLLCGLEHGHAGLFGRIGEGDARPIVHEASAEEFLEEALRCYFELVSHEPEGAASEGKPLVEQGLGVVLTNEEMDAFL